MLLFNFHRMNSVDIENVLDLGKEIVSLQDILDGEQATLLFLSNK